MEKTKTELTFYCDTKKHLICVPYSIDNLHLMATILGIHKNWFHYSNGRAHYDIPKQRIKEIQSKAVIIKSTELLSIIQSHTKQNEK